MRLKINLATQPYEDARRFIIAWSTIIGVLLIVLIALSVGVAKSWQHYRARATDLNRERNVLQELDAKQQEGMAILNRQDNRDVREKSTFINELIRRKTVSWTTVFADLEQLMPSDLRVLSVAPKIEHDKIMIQMQLSGNSRDKAAELARRMELSNVFRDAQIVNETAAEQSNGQPTTGEDSRHFTLIAEYVPGEALAKAAEKARPDISIAQGGGQ